MNERLSLEDANAFTVMLVQALLGAVSANFRCVAISFEKFVWEVQFILEKEDAGDREEIEDVMNEFDGLIAGYAPSGMQLKATIAVSTDSLAVHDPATWRVVFRRREAVA